MKKSFKEVREDYRNRLTPQLGQIDPFRYPYQAPLAELGAQAIEKHGIAYYAMEMRTGKTITALMCAAMLGTIGHVVFVTTKKAVPSIKRDYALGNFFFRLFVINYEGLHKAPAEASLIIYDEAHRLGAFPLPGKATKAARERFSGVPAIYLSGTPTPETMSQIYHQLWVNDRTPWREHKNFYEWARSGYVTVQNKWIGPRMIRDYTKSDQKRILREISKFTISWTQTEAGFEFDTVEEKILTSPAPSWFKTRTAQLKAKKILSIGEKDILADTPAKLLSKLHQMAGGSVFPQRDPIIDPNPEPIILFNNKAEFIKKEFAGKRIAIFYKFQGELQILKSVFPDATTDVEEFRRGEASPLLGQIKSCSMGIDLSMADALVGYSIDFSALTYLQIKQRGQSKEGKEPPPFFWVFTEHSIEPDVYEAVSQKESFTTAYYRKNFGKS